MYPWAVPEAGLPGDTGTRMHQSEGDRACTDSGCSDPGLTHPMEELGSSRVEEHGWVWGRGVHLQLDGGNVGIWG